MVWAEVQCHCPKAKPTPVNLQTGWIGYAFDAFVIVFVHLKP